MPSHYFRNSIRDWSRSNGRLRRDEDEDYVPVLRRSLRLAAKQEASKHVIPAPAPAPAQAPAQAQASHAEKRNDIIAQLADCKCRYCVSETKCNHEASCEWCRTHPEWRLISHNMTILMENMEKLRTKEAKISGALAVISYVNDNVIEFAKAHQKFKNTVIQKCQEFIAEAGDSVILCLVCADVIYKLKA